MGFGSSELGSGRRRVYNTGGQHLSEWLCNYQSREVENWQLAIAQTARPTGGLWWAFLGKPLRGCSFRNRTIAQGRGTRIQSQD